MPGSDKDRTAQAAAVEALRELRRRGYTLTPKTHGVVHEHRVGAHKITYADKLLVSGGPGPLDDAMREIVREQQPYLLAAACVLNPPIDWLVTLVDRYMVGELSLTTLSANVASFLGRCELGAGSEFEYIIEEALRGE